MPIPPLSTLPPPQNCLKAMSISLIKSSFIFTLIAVGCCTLTGCSESEVPAPQPRSTRVAGEVILAPDSPKNAYVKTQPLALTQHALMEAVAGKIVYDESRTTRISSPVTGRVIDTPVTLGAQVQAGDSVLVLTSPEVADIESESAKAQADLQLAERAYQRQQDLYAGKAIARKELEQAQDDWIRARSEWQRTQDRLKNLHIQGKQTDGRFLLRTALAGTVVERHANPGMEVRPDLEQALFVVSDLGQLTVLMQVFEMDLDKIRLGQTLSVQVPAYPEHRFPATVSYIGQVLDEATRTIQVRCTLPNPDGRLLPGMYATVQVESGPEDLAIVIPLTAVFTEGDNDFVFVALDEHHFKQKPVTIALRLKDKAIIRSGLSAGEQLVTEGALMLRAEEEVDTAANVSQTN